MDKYKTFGPRFWAGFVDGLVFLPISVFDSYLSSQFDDALGKGLATAIGVDLVLSKTAGMEKLVESVQKVLKRNASGPPVLSV